MARDWYDLFISWSKPPSETEEEKASRAATMIRAAINEYEPLRQKRTEVYATGSYRNNTNTRLESDIDVAVVLRDCFYSEYPANGLPQAADLGHRGDARYTLPAFRDDVGEALTKKFGSTRISRGAKAFDVQANTGRLDADVAVFLEHRRYTGRRNADGSWHYHEGVEMRGAKNERIINWHAEHYSNGVRKNNETCRRYKRVVRILKRVRDDMRNSSDSATSAAANVPSFMLECLAYNASNDCYQRDHLYDDVRAVVAQMWNKTKPDREERLVEVSGMKWLFGASQPWSKAEAHNFLLRAWNHIGFR